MKSFDPDDELGPPEPDFEGGRQLDEDLVSVDVDAALTILDRITADLPGGGESRQGQRDMVAAVASAFSRRRHAIIEAGTGVGKSLAYLIPAALTGQRVVIATATKNLQDQLAQKDAPTVAGAIRGTKVAILKGKQNYICRNRTDALQGAAQMTFDDGSELPRGSADQVKRILRWANETTSGDFDELPFEVDGGTRRALSVTAQECLGKAKCPQGHVCFHEFAKDRAAEAQLVIVNTHLYASHLASGSMLLPAHDYVVFDEAHEVQDIFATLLGTSVSAGRMRALAGVAKPLLGVDFNETCNDLVNTADRFASALAAQFEAQQLKGLGEDASVALGRSGELVTMIVEALRSLEATTADAEVRKTRALGPAIHLANDLARVNKVKDGELLFLAKRDREVSLEVSLVDVGPRLRDELWDNVTAVLTSATVPDTLARNLGLDNDVEIQRFESPFNYADHSLLYVPEGMPDRNSPDAEAAIIEHLITLIRAAGGRTLALFTNRAVMERVAKAVEKKVDTEILVQGTLSRQRIIEEFRNSAEASLFAVTSFWQGIDVPGHSLSLVTIDRLPFTVPNDPLVEARRELCENPFMEVDLPRATMLLAQGVGRLIRSANDRGVVAVLDNRLAVARYKGVMFKKLPPMKRTRDEKEVVAFLSSL